MCESESVVHRHSRCFYNIGTEYKPLSGRRAGHTSVFSQKICTGSEALLLAVYVPEDVVWFKEWNRH